MSGPDRTYREQVDPVTSDKTGRVNPVPTTLRRLVIKLDAALNEQPFRIHGDFIYADNNSTGVVTIKLNNTSEDPFPFLSQSMVEGLPIKDIFVSCAAQPGLVLNLWYGYQARMRPPQSVIQVVGQLTAAGVPQGQDLVVSNGNAFSVRISQGAVAAQQSMIQCSNPAASAKRMYLDSIDFAQTDGAGDRYDVAYSSVELGSAVGANATLRKSDGTQGASSTRGRTDATGAANGNLIGVVQSIAAVDFRPYVFNPPIKCDQGAGVTVRRATVNLICQATFHFREY